MGYGMKAWTVVAYAYEAALHCPECASKRFGENPPPYAHGDREGNLITPMFASSEDWQGESCDDCRAELGG